ncbi:hypothetical protein VCHA53O466_50217 [Vibrio chagasii]|nr:hypothetical protein VCHA53O466_50217 [Vibrio chagasii]
MSKLEHYTELFDVEITNHCEVGSPTHIYSEVVWLYITSTGRTDYNLPKVCHIIKMLKGVRECNAAISLLIKQFIPNSQSLVDDVDLIDGEIVSDALVAIGLANKTITYWFNDDESEDYLLKDDLGEYEQEVIDHFLTEYHKSQKALDNICSEFGLNKESILMRKDFYHGVFGVYNFPQDCNNSREIIQRYDDERGRVVNPETGDEGFDPLLHLTFSYSGIGEIGFFNPDYITASKSEIEKCLYEIAQSDPELMSKAKNMAIDKRVALLES